MTLFVGSAVSYSQSLSANYTVYYISFLKSKLKVLLVTGGYYGEMDDARRLEETSSTEVYVEGASAWTKGPPLPRTLIGLRGVSVNNEILMIGTFKIHV